MTTYKFLSLITIRTSHLVFPKHTTIISDRSHSHIINKNYLRTLFKNQIMGCRTSKVEITKKKTQGVETGSAGTQKEHEDEYVEDIVCCETDINENEMKVFELGNEGKVLLIKQKGKIHALGSKCTHYGAPLVSSALGDGRVRCQWHGACFNIETGDIEDFPGLDSLPCHQVTIDDNCQVKVRAKKSELTGPRVKEISDNVNKTEERYVVIGGGPAGALCVQTLREENFGGVVTMICKEPHYPYDRIKVSKMGLFDLSKNLLRPASYYQERSIDVKLGVEAAKVDIAAKKVHLANGTTVDYAKLFIATGSKPRVINVPGKDLENVITLRDYEDGKKWVGAINRETKLVILGNSFIGMEAAAYCADKVAKVTVVSRSKYPFQESLGEDVGQAVYKLFESKGVHFHSGTSIKTIKDNGKGQVGGVELDDGTALEADVLILGIGSTFNTDFLKDSGINLRDDGSIEVDEYLNTNVEGVFAGGDIAHAPIYAHNNERGTIGHWGLSHYHGKHAALNMLDRKRPIKAVPYFWTMLFGKGIRYAGYGKYSEVLHTGDLDQLKFVAFYIDEKEEVVAVCSCGMDPVVSQFAELLYQGRKLKKADLGEGLLQWVSTVAVPPPKGPVTEDTA